MAVREHVLILLAPDEATVIAAVSEAGGGTLFGNALPAETRVERSNTHICVRASGGLAPVYNDALTAGWRAPYAAESTFDGVPNYRGSRKLDNFRAEKSYLILEAPSVAAVQTQLTNIAGGSLFGFPLTGGRAAGIRIPKNGPAHLCVLGPAGEIATIAAQPDAGGWTQVSTGQWDDDDMPESTHLAYAWGYLIGSGGD